MKKYSLFLILARKALAAPFKSFLGTYIIASAHELDSTTHDDTPEYGSPEFWWKMGISVALVLLGGVFAGYVFDVNMHG